MGCQIIAVLFIFAWTFTIMGIYFWILNWFDLLRIDALEEEVGMDISRHKGSAYDMSGAAQEEHVEDLNRSRHKSFGMPEKEEDGVPEEAEKVVELTKDAEWDDVEEA
jgi:Amt family ammonium transporter